jgi:ADP-ribose diphosphatase
MLSEPNLFLLISKGMPKRTDEREIFKTKLFTIKDIDLELENGKKVTYQIMHKNNTALLVPITNDGQLLLIQEYFTAIDEFQLGLPKGRIEDGEHMFETANKELQEEVGYKAQKLDKLATFTMSPGYLTQRTEVFLARDLVESKLRGDEEWDLTVIRHPFSDFEALIASGKLTEARIIAALFLARRFLEKST